MKLLVIQVAALGRDFLEARLPSMTMADMTFAPLRTVFPAVTCTVQAGFRTGTAASEHGVVGNGFYDRALRRAWFWEQSSGLCEGARIWDGFRAAGGRVGSLFWQQSLGSDCDVVISPAPIHRHHGGMVESVYTWPRELEKELSGALGAFRLRHYWGPLASRKSTEWIAAATGAMLQRADAPELLLTYLPHLDYELQQSGPESAKSGKAFWALRDLLAALCRTARGAGYRVLVFGDYNIEPVSAALLPNLALVEAGLMRLREVGGMQYPDFHRSEAFALVDHQVAHIFCGSERAVGVVREVFEGAEGVARVMGAEEKRAMGVDHARAGDLVLMAEAGWWFGYGWWVDGRQAPDYACHVDIHNKPGYDPCELFFGRLPFRTSLDVTRVHGSHGRVTERPQAVFATDLPLAERPETVLELAGQVRELLEAGR